VKFVARLLVALALAPLFSCGRGLDPSAEIRYAAQMEDPALGSAASKLSGMTLFQYPAPEYWSLRLSRDKAMPLPNDLFRVDWGRALIAAQEGGSLASLESSWRRTESSRRMPSFTQSIAPTPAEGFVPASVYSWGLFYNRRLMDALGSPAMLSMDEFEALLDSAKGRGLVPIALGASFGWPGAAWHTYLDLRRNGGKAAWERIMGSRPFDDAGGKEAAQLLAKWRDAGYFSPDAGLSGMEESLASVEAGRALCVLMGSFAADRFRVPSDIGFMQVPFWNGLGNPRGEIAGVSGFAITSWSRKPEAALALVDSYLLAGSTEPASGTYQLPILFQRGDGADLRAVQSRILAGAQWILPSQERIMLPRFVQDSLREWAGFFAPGSAVSGTDLAAALQSLRVAAEKGEGP
jgi:hypothetical protein